MAKTDASSKRKRREPSAKRPSAPTKSRGEKNRTARRRDTAAALDGFRTYQVENVPADEVDALIAEERATSDVVSVHRRRESDGQFTVTFVVRIS